jgi:hypothetical protein
LRAEHPHRAWLLRASLLLLAVLTLTLGVHSAAASTRQVARAQAATVDPNTLGRGSGDAVSVVSWISPGTYQLAVQNTSGIGYINTFSWTPPTTLTITAVTKSEGGKCSLVGGDIQCSGKIAPPKCTCAAGGDLTVTFTAKGLEPTFANGYWTYYGFSGANLRIQSMTPVPYHIPSSLPTFTDFPSCKKGQKSTKARPCI